MNGVRLESRFIFLTWISKCSSTFVENTLLSQLVCFGTFVEKGASMFEFSVSFH